MRDVGDRVTRRRLSGAGAWLALVAVATCARNPVTGQRELSLVSQSQEIAMGRDAAKEAAASMGVVQDTALQAYVTSLGMPLARASERPTLPWSFTVLDDPAVNAFALPGGPVFVTRGILTHMNSEAQLVSVLGHEIGHITAKHSVAQISRAQIAQIGISAAVVVKPGLARFGDLASEGLGLVFLKFGRDDETQADGLGFRYMTAAGYNPGEMAEMFRTLGRLSAGGGGHVPGWLSTHPDPGNRVQKTRDRIAATPALAANLKVEREAFVRHTDGLTFGEDPRQGFFRGTSFLHPDMKFQLDFPGGWKTQNQMTRVAGVSPQEDALVVVSVVANATPPMAIRQFFAQQGIANRGSFSSAAVNGLPAEVASFTATTQDATLAGWVVFANLDGTTLRLLAYTTSDKVNTYDAALRQSVMSFRRLTEPAALAVRPARVRLVRTTSAMTIEEFDRTNPSTIPVAQLALINGVELAAVIPAGTLVKRVVVDR